MVRVLLPHGTPTPLSHQTFRWGTSVRMTHLPTQWRRRANASSGLLVSRYHPALPEQQLHGSLLEILPTTGEQFRRREQSCAQVTEGSGGSVQRWLLSRPPR